MLDIPRMISHICPSDHLAAEEKFGIDIQGRLYEPAGMNLIYYSLVMASGAVQEDQWLQSVRSLRRYNGEVPVHLVIYDVLPPRIRSEAIRSAVTIHQMCDYTEYLRALSEHGALLTKYPTFHKFLSLHQLPTHGVSQILFLDCDTFFFDD